MATVTSSTLSNSVKTQYLRRLLIRAVPRLVHGRWAVKGNINGYGSAEFRKFAALSENTTVLTEGVTPDSESASVSVTTLNPSYYGAYLQHTDQIDYESYDPILSTFSSMLGEQAGLSADSLQRDALAGNVTTTFPNARSSRGSIAASTDNIDYADFVKALSTLMAANALPVDGEQFVVIIHPHTYATLMQDTKFTNTFFHASPRDDGNPMRTGFMGRFLNCDIYISSNAKEYEEGGASSIDVYGAFFIGREAYGQVGIGNIDPRDVDAAGPEGQPLTGDQGIKPVDIIVKPLGSGGSEDPLNQRATVAWKMAFATSVLNSAFAVELEHANEFS